MSQKRKWPTVPVILAQAARIEVVGWTAFYVDRGTGERVKIHAATIPNLLKTIHHDWTRDHIWWCTIYTRPEGCP